VNDPLYHRVVALDDRRGNRLFIVSTDIAVISPGYYDTVCGQIKQQLGLGPETIWWLNTHTHSAPEVGPPGIAGIFLPDRYKQAATGESNPEYSRLCERKLVDALREAQAKLEPARLGIGVGQSLANINRRARDADGKVRLGMNPEGPVDRQVGLIRLERMDGSRIALIANYPIHGTVLGSANRKISGDAPGIVAAYVEEKLGGAPMLFINGAEGNVAPLYSGYPDPRAGHLGEFRVLLGDRILEADKNILKTTDRIALRATAHTVETPRRAGLAWPADLQDYTRTADGSAMVLVPVRFLQINRDAVLWGSPVELFSEIATAVREKSPFRYTFYFGLLNGTLGYLPTAQAMREQGYEPSVSPFTEKVEIDFREAVIGRLKSLRSNR
jgi:hypothetical protein